LRVTKFCEPLINAGMSTPLQAIVERNEFSVEQIDLGTENGPAQLPEVQEVA
jgi:hypothetical protein